MIAKQTMPISGVSNTSRPGRIEMKVMEMPASEPSSAARGVIRRITGPMKPPIISTKLCTNTQVSPASQAWMGSLVVEDRQHHHEGDDEHVRHAGARRQGGDVAAAGLRGETIGEPGVIHRREEQHQPEGGKNSAEDQRIRHFQHEAQQPRQDQNIDQDVGPEAEKGVPVARNPKALAAPRGRWLHSALSHSFQIRFGSVALFQTAQRIDQIL